MSTRVSRTKLCDMLGIDYPILSAGRGLTLIGETTGAPVDLVVAVSEAGGWAFSAEAAFRLRVCVPPFAKSSTLDMFGYGG